MAADRRDSEQCGRYKIGNWAWNTRSDGVVVSRSHSTVSTPLPVARKAEYSDAEVPGPIQEDGRWEVDLV